MAPQPSYERRPYQRRSNYGVWIGLAVAAVLIVVAAIMFSKQQASRPPPTEAPTVDPAVQRRLEERAAEEKERQRQLTIGAVRQKLQRIDRRIASNKELLKDEYSWTRERDLAEAKELATKRAQVVEELAGFGEEP